MSSLLSSLTSSSEMSTSPDPRRTNQLLPLELASVPSSIPSPSLNNSNNNSNTNNTNSSSPFANNILPALSINNCTYNNNNNNNLASELSNKTLPSPYNGNNTNSRCDDSGIVEDCEFSSDVSSPLVGITNGSGLHKNTLNNWPRTKARTNLSEDPTATCKSAGLRHQVNIEQTTVLVSRIDGRSLSTGASVTLYKCHLCCMMFSHLNEIQMHLTVHAERRLTLFQCRLCNTNFPLKKKLIRHLRARHHLHVPLQVDIPEAMERKDGAPEESVEVATDLSCSAVNSSADASRAADSTFSVSPRGAITRETPVTQSFTLSTSFKATSSKDRHINDVTNCGREEEKKPLLESCPGSTPSFPTSTCFSDEDEDGGEHGPLSQNTSAPANLVGNHNHDLNPNHNFSRSHDLNDIVGGEIKHSEVVKQETEGTVRDSMRKARHPCRTCGREFRKRRSLYQHAVRCRAERVAIDLSNATTKLMSNNGRVGNGDVNGNLNIDKMMAPASSNLFFQSLNQNAFDRMSNAFADACKTAASGLNCKSESVFPHTQSSNVANMFDNETAISKMHLNGVGRDSTDVTMQMFSKEHGESLVLCASPSHRSTESDCSSNYEIRSAPIKSMLSPTQAQFKSKRRHSIAAAIGETSDISNKPTELAASVRSAETPTKRSLLSESNAAGTNMIALTSKQPMMTTGGTLTPLTPSPFGPIDISPMLRGGYLPLPLISLFLSQSALATSSLLSGATNMPSTHVQQMLAHHQLQQQLQQHQQIMQQSESASEGPRATPAVVPCESSWDRSSQFSDSPRQGAASLTQAGEQMLMLPHTSQQFEGESSSEGGGEGGSRGESLGCGDGQVGGEWKLMERRMKGLAAKGTSLSKTQSRLYVVPEPVKRTDAFKPVVMSDGQTVYRCTYCNKDFSTVSDINRHMDFHEDIRPYKCSHCDYHARTNSQLKVHNMRHQGIRKFQCCLCNYKGVTQSDLNRHAKSQIHLLKARNQCGSCGEGFVSPVNLGKHFHERHNDSVTGAELTNGKK